MNVDMKVFEIRDEGTCISWLAFRFAYPMSEKDRWLLARVGYGLNPCEWPGVIQGPAAYPEDWNFHAAAKNPRTQMAARHIEERFDELESGQVIDIRVVLGESDRAVASDQP